MVVEAQASAGGALQTPAAAQGSGGATQAPSWQILPEAAQSTCAGV